jgi:hypothetical protein
VCTPGRRQRLPRNASLVVGQPWQDVALIQLRRSTAIEADEPDLGMGVEEGAKIVRDRVIRDVRIETPGTVAAASTSQSATRLLVRTRTRPA